MRFLLGGSSFFCRQSSININRSDPTLVFFVGETLGSIPVKWLRRTQCQMSASWYLRHHYIVLGTWYASSNYYSIEGPKAVVLTCFSAHETCILPLLGGEIVDRRSSSMIAIFLIQPYALIWSITIMISFVHPDAMNISSSWLLCEPLTKNVILLNVWCKSQAYLSSFSYAGHLTSMSSRDVINLTQTPWKNCNLQVQVQLR